MLVKIPDDHVEAVGGVDRVREIVAQHAAPQGKPESVKAKFWGTVRAFGSGTVPQFLIAYHALHGHETMTLGTARTLVDLFLRDGLVRRVARGVYVAV